MSNLVDRFVTEHGSYDDVSEDRQKLWRKVLREFEASLEGRPLLEATGPDLKAFLATQVDAGLKPTTVRKHLNAIRPFYSWAFDEKLVGGDTLMELRRVKPPRGATGNGQPKPYRDDEVKRFWAELAERYPWVRPKRGPNTPEQGRYWLVRFQAGNSRWARPQPYARRVQIEAIAWLALGGGLRMEEIFRLALDDMTAEGEYLVVRSAAKNLGAENRDRGVPWMTNDMRAAVARWLDLREQLDPPHDRPWLSLVNEARLHPMQWRTFEMLMRKIGRGWEFHRLRHTAATTWLRAGVPLESVSRILGHARIQQTLGYAQIVRTDLVAAAARSEAEVAKALAPKAPA